MIDIVRRSLWNHSFMLFLLHFVRRNVYIWGYIANNEAKAREHATMIESRQIAKKLGLQMKIGDVDPRGAAVEYENVSDKARAIGGGVLEAIWIVPFVVHPYWQLGRL